jgi:hypothetical protein
MSKEMLFNITNKLKPLIAKKDTRYWFVIPIKVKVAYVIYKLFHGSNLLNNLQLANPQLDLFFVKLTEL